MLSAFFVMKIYYTGEHTTAANESMTFIVLLHSLGHGLPWRFDPGRDDMVVTLEPPVHEENFTLLKVPTPWTTFFQQCGVRHGARCWASHPDKHSQMIGDNEHLHDFLSILWLVQVIRQTTTNSADGEGVPNGSDVVREQC